MTPEQEEQVRQALAATARAEPQPDLPPEVAGRLDDVLADLVAGRAQRADAGVRVGGDELAARRRHTRRQTLAAAATVLVIAAAGAAVATGGFGVAGSGSASSGSASSASQDSVAAPDTGNRLAAGGAPSAAPGVRAAGVPVARLRSASLGADVQRLVGSAAAAPSARSPQAGRSVSCARPAVPRGADLHVVRLDGKPATLVLDPATGGTREARIYSCADGSSPVATTRVRAR